MDIGKSFVFMFEDPNWVAKLAIGGGILLLGTILSFLVLPLLAAVALVLGYSLVVTRNVYEGNPYPLPEWANLGDLFVKGLTALVGLVVWTIPVWVIVCCIWATIFFTGGAAGVESEAGQGVAALGGLLSTCLGCLAVIVSLAIALFVYAPLTNFAITNNFASFWDFAGSWRFIQNNIGNYVIAFLLMLVASFLAGFGVIACVIGVFFTNFWAYLVTAHLFGQVARTNLAPAEMMAPPTVPPPAPPGAADIAATG